MAMTVVVTRNVPDRFRGFLASVMLEIAPGVYTSPHMTRAVRDRVWRVCEEWFPSVVDGSILMTWRAKDSPGGQWIRTLGIPHRELIDHEGIVLARSEITKDIQVALEKSGGGAEGG